MIIYKITNNINGKIYIGQTTRSLEERLSEHKRKRKPLISKALRKYGIENFSIEIIYEASTIDELNKKEFEFIRKYNCITPNGYNQCEGGGNTIGYNHTKEAKERMSKAKSKIYTGENNPMYGKHHSDEAKKKMSEKRKNRKLTDEWKKKIGDSCKKKVINIDTGEIFNSIKEAAEYYNLKDTHISRVCKGKRNKTGGFRWKYFE